MFLFVSRVYYQTVIVQESGTILLGFKAAMNEYTAVTTSSKIMNSCIQWVSNDPRLTFSLVQFTNSHTDTLSFHRPTLLFPFFPIVFIF